MAIAEFPQKLDFLFEPYRYKVAYGGRGGGKSHSFAKALLILGTQKPLRILASREFQSSIADSVHKLLVDQIYLLELQSFYTIEKASISGLNGTEFRFAGLKTNVQAIKSFEGINICWVEEASNVSKQSWEVLVPTIRQENSEIWVSFNPELESDETYQRFVLNPRPGSKVVQINYSDNIWFPEVLKEEMEFLKRIDDNAYQNVWLGHPKVFLDGAVYGNEIKAAMNATPPRITTVPYDPLKAVHTIWDIGFRDTNSIWFAQVIGSEFRFIDYYENNQLPLDHYLQMLQSKSQEFNYVYGVDYLPHDAAAKSLGTGRSVEEMMREKGRKIFIVPRLSIEDGINAARTIFPNSWFDKDKCVDGIQCLRKYRYDTEGSLTSNRPIHDHFSHGADAFRYAAVALREAKKPFDASKLRPVFKGSHVGQQSWMAR